MCKFEEIRVSIIEFFLLGIAKDRGQPNVKSYLFLVFSIFFIHVYQIISIAFLIIILQFAYRYWCSDVVIIHVFKLIIRV